MPEVGLNQKFELETRNRYTKVNASLTLKLEGRELPNMAVLGEALEEAILLVENKIKQSYQEVPARDGNNVVQSEQARGGNTQPQVEPKPDEPEQTKVPTF